MDKELIEKLLKGVYVNGDLVMEKHVENEIGNVESGGIGIQIVHGPDKGTPCKPNANACPPALLDTPPGSAIMGESHRCRMGGRRTTAYQPPGHKGGKGGVLQM